jgi:hypothetical protein
MVTAVSTVLLIASFAVVLALGWRLRTRVPGGYPVVQTSAALLAAFMLFNKVHSPQYTLWILPFFVLLNVRIVWWLAYTVVDLMVYVGVFRWFYDVVYQGRDFTFFKKLLLAGLWSRAALLAMLIVAFALAQTVRRRQAVEPAVLVGGLS